MWTGLNLEVYKQVRGRLLQYYSVLKDKPEEVAGWDSEAYIVSYVYLLPHRHLDQDTRCVVCHVLRIFGGLKDL